MASTRFPSLADLARVHASAAAILRRPPGQPLCEGLSHCEVDGLPLADHPRCRRCRILVGPHHYRVSLIDGLCEACYLDVRGRGLK